MKLSCLPVSLFDEIIEGPMSLKDWALSAKSIGLDGIDISMAFIKNHTPTYLDTVKEDLLDAGMPVVMVNSYPDFTHPSARQRERERDYLRRDIALASELGIHYVRILAGQAHPGMGLEEGIELAVSGLRETAKIARQYEQKLVYENHAKPGAWNYIDFSFPLPIFTRIYDGIRGSGIGVNFDIGNVVAYGEKPFDLLDKVFRDVETIHVSDMRKYGEFSPVAIGTGVAPIGEIFSYLKSRRFGGWLSIEEASFSGIDGIRKAVEYVRNTWEKA